jgi:rhodanese-related sulfurtransferase
MSVVRRSTVSTDVWIAAALALVAALLLAPRLLGARRVPMEDVKGKLVAGAVVVDVRTPEEFRGGAYPGATNIPVQELGQRLGELPRDRPVVLYCRSGQRSAAAAQLLRQAGFTDVVNAGGLGDMPR